MENKENGEYEYITEEEAKTIKGMFWKYLKSYKEKEPSVSDEKWLEQLFESELTDLTAEERRQDAADIVKSIHTFDDNLSSVNEAAQKGVSKEKWLADKMQETSVGMSVSEYGRKLQVLDDVLTMKNIELEEALRRKADGHIKMSPNLDGNIAEHMIAESTGLSAGLQGKQLHVEVRDVFTKNSVDVRVTNQETGQWKNYQLKFGKDAKATIGLIERGNYNNQQIIVPTEQLNEIQAHFQEKGSEKTISDHIEAWGAEGKKFTKDELKQLQKKAQEEGIYPEIDYTHFQTKDLAMSIGKNAGALAFQTAAVTTGLNVAYKLFQGEKIEADELVETAIRTGTDTSVKVVAAGTLQVAIRRGIIKFLPKMLGSSIIANIACVGIENIKVLVKIATGEITPVRGMDQMGRVTVSMVGGLWLMAKGATVGSALVGWIPVLGAPLGVAAGFVGGMAGYFGGSKLGDAVYHGAKKIFGAAKNAGKAAVSAIKSAGRKIGSKVKNAFRKSGGKLTTRYR